MEYSIHKDASTVKLILGRISNSENSHSVWSSILQLKSVGPLARIQIIRGADDENYKSLMRTVLGFSHLSLRTGRLPATSAKGKAEAERGADGQWKGGISWLKHTWIVLFARNPFTSLSIKIDDRGGRRHHKIMNCGLENCQLLFVASNKLE
jgi:hypothetical protein